MIRCSINALTIVIFLVCSCSATEIIEIPDEGWRLWPDTAAVWENDDIYLPNEVNLSKIAVNEPTGGWTNLNSHTGIEVTLPTTVEQHFWGKFGYRDYKDEYYFEYGDKQVKNGNFKGVSWWWKEIEIPKSFKEKIVILEIRGARLRAEIFLNRQLVGYNIITETSINCDLTKAIRPGEKNLLAIRITNPGGRIDWLDTKLLQWGKYKFHAGHGFGGLDRGLVLSAHDSVYISDLWVLNTPQITKIKPHVLIKNTTDENIKGILKFEIVENDDPDRICASIEKEINIAAYNEIVEFGEIDYRQTNIWDTENPNLYTICATILINTSNNVCQDENGVFFGFRWFEADGIGDNAVLRLNKNRIRLISAISWGFWGMNGLWPDKEMAEREVYAAKRFGMNCINFHRNTGKTEVLDAHDRLGLMRYMEPGGGQTALGEKFTLYADSPEDEIDKTGKTGEPLTFAEKYMEEKILGMIRDHRSHPSLIMYCIQNEINPDLHNPRIFNLLRKMQNIDPSRIIILKSGIPDHNQAWVQPYNNEIFIDDGTSYSGWWDKHTVGGSGVWQDVLYKSPEEFTHRSENKKEIIVWGEMLGAATPDNHENMINEIKKRGEKSYDLKDHSEINLQYKKFLDKWNFKPAFKNPGELFIDIGNKCYDFWGRVIETAKLSDENDFLVISGWESTAIENHSGLLDNLRGFKGDPTLIGKRLEKLRPVIKSRSLVIEKGNNTILDLYLINETNKPHCESTDFYILDPDGQKEKIDRFNIPEFKKDQFVYKITDELSTPFLKKEGKYKLVLQLNDKSKTFSEEEILVIEVVTANKKDSTKVGVFSNNSQFISSMKTNLDIDAELYQPEKEYDVLLVSDRLLHGWRSEVESEREIINTDDDILYHTESWGYYRNLEYVFENLPEGKAEVTLRLAEVTLKNPGDRIMNVAINGDTVLNDFDIVARVGAPNISFDTTFTVDVIDGTVKITVPKLTVNYAKFSAIKVIAHKTVVAINCGGPEYVDKTGLVWKPYRQQVHLTEKILEKVKNGLSLLLIPEGQEATEVYGELLGNVKAIEYLGHVGKTRASWMGSWYFVRQHLVFDGLPVNQAMKSYYQVPVSNSDGLLLDGDNIKVFVGYGRDHDRNVGAAGFTAQFGKGKILFFSIPGILSGVTDKQTGMHPVMAKRLLKNSLAYLTE